jgi:hypothetical protein
MRRAIGGGLVAALAAGTVATMATAAGAVPGPTTDPSGDAHGGIDVVAASAGHTSDRVVFTVRTASNIFSRLDDAVTIVLDVDSDRAVEFDPRVVFDPTSPGQTFIECDTPPLDDSIPTTLVSNTEIRVSVGLDQLQACGLTATSFEWGVLILSFVGDDIYDAAPNDYDIENTPGYVVNLAAADPNARFVGALYTDFLGRPADQGGLDFWTEQLLLGRTRTTAALAFAQSDEWIGVTVDDMYETTLGRPADQGGRNFWITQIRNGRSVPSMGGFFYGSNEYFTSSGGTAGAWIDQLYLDILGRSSDQGGRDFWVGRFNAGMPRDLIALNFFQSIENRRQRVSRLYDLLLDRLPDAVGLEFWANRILTDGDLSLAAFLAGSDEYFDHAQLSG